METLGSAQVYESPFLAVREDAVRRDDGSEEVHVVVDAPDIALVVAVQGDRVCLVEQYRHPVGGRRWEFPSGSHDARRRSLRVTDAKSVAAYALLLLHPAGRSSEAGQPVGSSAAGHGRPWSTGL